MSLYIDQLTLDLPAHLHQRSGAIQRLLRRELSVLNWPQGDWPAMRTPDVSLNQNATNLAIARSIASQLHRSAWQRADGQMDSRDNRSATEEALP